MKTFTFEDITKIKDIADDINNLDYQIEKLKEILVSNTHFIEVRDMRSDGVSNYLFTLKHEEICDLIESRKKQRDALYKLIETNYEIKIKM